MSDNENNSQALRKMRLLPRWSDLKVLLVIAGASFALGISINAIRSSPLPWIYVPPAQLLVAKQIGESPARVEGQPPSQFNASGTIKIVSIEEVLAIVEQKTALVLDARPSLFYELGHLPSAVNLSRKTFDVDYAKLRPQIDGARAEGRPVLLYCADVHCPDAGYVAGMLKKEFPVVLLFAEGWAEWEASGYPKETGS